MNKFVVVVFNDDPKAYLSGGTAVMAHVGGFVAGALMVRLFEDEDLTSRRLERAVS